MTDEEMDALADAMTEVAELGPEDRARTMYAGNVAAASCVRSRRGDLRPS